MVRIMRYPSSRAHKKGSILLETVVENLMVENLSVRKEIGELRVQVVVATWWPR